MEEISEMEKRKRIVFDEIGELRHVGRELLLKLLMEKFIGSNQSLETYLRSERIYNQFKNCRDFTRVQKDNLLPKNGATFCINKFDINLICKLICKLPLLSSEESVQGYTKIKVNPYEGDVENITTILEETYDLGIHLVDINTLEEGSKNLRDIYKSVAKDLPQEEQLKIVQLIDGEVQVPNVSSVPDKCDKEYGTVEDTTEHVKIPVQNWRHGQIIPLEVNKMEEYCKSGHLIKEEEFRSFYKWGPPNSKKKYLIKKLVFPDREEDKDLKEKYYTELHHETILHPHVVPIIALAQSCPQYPRVMYLMYPYMENGSVRTKIELENKGESFRSIANESNSSVWIRCIYQVASALDYLHNIGKHGLRGPVFHRNITSSTIHFDECFNAKLCDFGRAVEAKINAVDATDIPNFTVPGYHPSMPDETCYKASYDVYSLCVVILEILTGEVVKVKKDEKPFSDLKSDSQLLMKLDTDINYELRMILNRLDDNRDGMFFQNGSGDALYTKRPKVAKWNRKDVRNELARRAWEIFRMNETEMAEVKANDVLKIIKDARIESYKLYIEDTNTENCVSCYINKRATTLPLKGNDCKDCTMFCVHCLTDYHNELICPQHGPTRRPFGDHVYGVFVAGNHVDELPKRLTFHGNTPRSAKDIAKLFIRDAKKLVNVLTSMCPLVLGARPDHFEVVTPKKPGKEVKMKRFIDEAFEKIKKLIGDDQQKYQDKTNPLFIFYFSGHCDPNEETGKGTHQNSNEHLLYLGGQRETATTEWLRDMLDVKLFLSNVLVVLDCCYASGHDFVNKSNESRFQIYQLSSCDKTLKSVCDPTKGSYFTHFLCQALRGVGSHEDNEVRCGDCIKEKKGPSPCQSFHVACLNSQKITLNDVETYIQNHYELLKLKMDVKKHAKNAGIIELAYYKKLNKRSFIIRLEGSESGQIYRFNEVPDSIACLRKDIVKYIDEKKIQCQIHEMLKFHNTLYESSEDKKAHKYVIKETTHLVAIYQQYDQETKEVTCLNDLLKISPSLMSLVAKIRQDVNGLRHGHLKYDRIKKAMITNWPECFFSKGFGISQDCLQFVCKVEESARILKEIEDMESAKPEEQFHENKWLLNNLYQLIVKCQSAGAFDETETKVLKFRVYEPFSILQYE